MSNRSRLILLSGLGGSGVTTLTAATAEALRGEGLRVTVVDATGTEPFDAAADALVVGAIGATVGRLLGDAGADPVVPESWASAGFVRQLSALTAIARGLAEADVVVVDSGPLARVRELVDLPSVLVRLLDAALTPRTAMWRGGDGEPALFEALSAARIEVLRLQRLLRHPATSARLVMRPTPDAVEPTARTLAALGMLGVAVDGVIVNRFPRGRERWPDQVVIDARDALTAMRDAADGVEVWKSTSAVRAVPKGRSAFGPLGRVRVLDSEQITVRVLDEEYRLDLPLAGAARSSAAVGVQGDSLVVSFDGALRWIDLPSVLRRCVPVSATRTDHGLSVAFVPDPARWRRPAEEAS